HLMNLKSFADRFNQCNGKFSAKMFAKLFQTVQKDERIIRTCVEHFVRKQIKTKRLKQVQSALRRGRIQIPHVSRINSVQRDSCRHSFPMSDTIFRELFEFVRRPLAK